MSSPEVNPGGPPRGDPAIQPAIAVQARHGRGQP
jgi:hypothetical protein